ncbi:TIGR02391 family protein [Streptomyces sp. IBSBF 2953]|uniref:TIGR02391 family protein n=1 Tax=Streptomyces TaxID=1883 RepID=UPI00211A8F28|nr:TIGR02391 family protein [Streptomyces scabiei]MCQ9182614.1 TIGR02391 family protein [Streptomyces hayashii]MDX3115161.1 TIGR02391 family protein [Streptomyces scabiei]
MLADHYAGRAGAECGDLASEVQPDALLFADAMCTYENPAGHRTVDCDDPIEAAGNIQFADLLLRQVERAKRRQAAPTT